MYVLLDNHGDQTGTLNCGYGIPYWFTLLAIEHHQGGKRSKIPELGPSELSIEINKLLTKVINVAETLKLSDKLGFTKEGIDSGHELDGLARIHWDKCNDWKEGLDHPQTYYLNNISVFFSKGSSIIFLLLGQIIFRFKHPDKSYMLRTNYTVKSNREWNKLFRNNRVNKRKTLESDVEKMKSALEITI